MQIPDACEQIALNRAPLKERVSLEQLAQQSAVVYLDNSVLDRSYNIAEICKSVQRDDFPVAGFAKLIGSCMRFSQLSIRHLRRQAIFALSLNSLICSYPSLRSVQEVVQEHSEFQKHISNSWAYLRKNSVPRTGVKEHLLRQAVEHYRETSQLLEERSATEPAAEEISRFLCENELYKPRGRAFRKRFTEAAASMADASLVSHALLAYAKQQNDADRNRKDVAIVTADTDIINLLDNYCVLQRRGELPPSFPRAEGGLRIYFPDDTRWFPHLALNCSYST